MNTVDDKMGVVPDKDEGEDDFLLQAFIEEHEETKELTKPEHQDIFFDVPTTNLLNDLKKAEEEYIQTRRLHQIAKASLWMDNETITNIQKQLEITTKPTVKQIESYIRLETKDEEIKRFEAETQYNNLNRVYELRKKELA